MKTRILMRASALVVGVVGLAFTFLPAEVLAYYDARSEWSSELLIQMAGAAYMGFAVMNWMARDTLIGGIYNRPLAMGNFLHFLVVAITLGKVLMDGHVRISVVIASLVFTVFAVWFGLVAFTHPSGPQSNQGSVLTGNRNPAVESVRNPTKESEKADRVR